MKKSFNFYHQGHSRMPQEVELKLALGRNAATLLRQHPVLRERSCTRMTLTNTYYDTPDGALEAARVALRLRRTPEQWLQTLKTAGEGAGGLSSRGEWEWPVDNGLDLAGLASLPPMQALGRDVLEALVARFTTDFERECWLIDVGEARIEVALDRGEIAVGTSRVAIDELELELKAGEPAALWRLARQLAEQVPLRPANASKAARGASLRDANWSPPERDATPAARFDHAVDCLDALADSGDDGFRGQAREALETLAVEMALHAEVVAPARAMAAALLTPEWLDTAFGRHSLALQDALQAH